MIESKLHPPWLRPGMVARPALVERLLAAPAGSVVWVVAPPGYGKTTLLAQWAQAKGDRVGWLAVDPHDNDPAVLLTYLAVALDRIAPIDPDTFQIVASPATHVPPTVVPRLAAAMSATTEPIDLALDHIEVLHNRQCLDVLEQLAVQLSGGSQLVLASRTRPRLPLGRLRGQGRLVEVGAADLAMDLSEARELLEGAEVRLAAEQAAELHGRTEGWPAGLYLAALALQAAGTALDTPAAGVSFAGDDRFIVDYLNSELLLRLPAEHVSFLTRTAVLDRMCGPLCDAVLDTTGSAKALESLAGSNLLLVPLDRRREWYRYHHLFRDLLGAELERREPALLPELHRRAAAWCEANGLEETAIDHAQAAGDADQVGRLVLKVMQPVWASGRVDTVLRWMEWFEREQLMERYPAVAVRRADLCVAGPADQGRAVGGGRRTGRSRASRRQHDGELSGLPAGHPVPRQRLRDAAQRTPRLGRTEPAESPGRPCCIPKGSRFCWKATRSGPMRNSPVPSRPRPRPVRRRWPPWSWPSAAASPPAATTGRRQRRSPTRRWRSSEAANSTPTGPAPWSTPGRPGWPCIAASSMGPRPPGAVGGLRPLLTHALPVVSVQALLRLARAYIALGDPDGAHAVLRQAGDIFQQRPNLGVLPAQANELRTRLATMKRTGLGASSLTTAELRLLPLLPSYLSFERSASGCSSPSTR